MKISINSKTMKTFIQRSIAMAVLSAASTGATLPNAWAGTPSTWNGSGTNSNWSTSGNWSTALNNATTYSLIFSGTNRTTNSNNIGGSTATVTVDSIQFTNNNTGANTGQFSISSAVNRTITLTNGATITTTAASTGSLVDVITSRVIANGTINFNLGANHGVNFIASSYTGSPTIVKSGAGTLQLGQTNARTYGGLTVDNGAVFLNTAAAVAGFSGQTASVGTATTSGTVRFNSASASGTTNMNFALNGNSTVSAQGSAKMVFSNPQFNSATSLASPVTLTLAGSKETQVIQGAIVDNVGAVSVAVTGSNTWVLQGMNTYTGSTTVGGQSGVLLDGLLGAGNVTVAGYLGGDGFTSGSVTVSGTISPGGTSTGGGVITDTIGSLGVGALTMGSTARALMSITGTDSASYDQIVGGSTMSFGGTLGLTLNGSYNSEDLYNNNQTWNLFNSFTSYTTGLTGITLDATGTQFAGMTFAVTGTAGIWETTTATPDLMGLKLQFNENTGTLAVVPEPSTIAFAGIGMAMFGWRSWTNRRRRLQRERIAAVKA